MWQDDAVARCEATQSAISEIHHSIAVNQTKVDHSHVLIAESRSALRYASALVAAGPHAAARDLLHPIASGEFYAGCITDTGDAHAGADAIANAHSRR